MSKVLIKSVMLCYRKQNIMDSTFHCWWISAHLIGDCASRVIARRESQGIVQTVLLACGRHHSDGHINNSCSVNCKPWTRPSLVYNSGSCDLYMLFKKNYFISYPNLYTYIHNHHYLNNFCIYICLQLVFTYLCAKSIDVEWFCIL